MRSAVTGRDRGPQVATCHGDEAGDEADILNPFLELKKTATQITGNVQDGNAKTFSQSVTSALLSCMPLRTH